MNVILVLLAAGNSSRFGENKLLYPIEGKPMYQNIVDTMEELKGEFREKIIVTQYKKIMEHMIERGYHIIENKDSNLGISHSISLAIGKVKFLSETGKLRNPYSICFCVCDQPYLRFHSIKGLIDGYAKSKKGIGCLSSNGIRGNPVIFSEKYIEELLKLENDMGGRNVLLRHIEDVYFHEIEDLRELNDIDWKKIE